MFLAGFGQFRCVLNVELGSEDCVRHNSWCTCETSDLCYTSTTVYVDDMGNLESFYEYGCIDFPGFPGKCPTDVRIQSLPDTITSYQTFNCCKDEDFCNENLTTVDLTALLRASIPAPAATPMQTVGESWCLSVIGLNDVRVYTHSVFHIMSDYHSKAWHRFHLVGSYKTQLSGAYKTQLSGMTVGCLRLRETPQLVFD